MTACAPEHRVKVLFRCHTECCGAPLRRTWDCPTGVGGRERKHLLGQPTNLEGKPEGERSLSVKRLSAKGCSVRGRKSCTHERGEAWIG
jgi:hypothetical protein